MYRTNALGIITSYMEREFIKSGTTAGMTAPFRREFNMHRHANKMWKKACDFVDDTDSFLGDIQGDVTSIANKERAFIKAGGNYARDYIDQAREFLDVVMFMSPCKVMQHIDDAILHLQASVYIIQNYVQGLARKLFLEFENFDFGIMHKIIIAQQALFDQWWHTVVALAKDTWKQMKAMFESAKSIRGFKDAADVCSDDFLDIMEKAVNVQQFQAEELITGSASIINLAIASIRRKIALLREIKKAKNALSSAIEQLEAALDEIKDIVPDSEAVKKAFTWK